MRGQEILTRLKLEVKVIIFLTLLILFVSNSNSFADDMDAYAAAVVDAHTGKILYGKNLSLKLPPASTAKLVTAMVVLDRLSPWQKITISKRAANTQTVTPKLNEGEVYTVHDLLYLALMRSVNSATVALAEAVAGSEEDFIKFMNEKAIKIGAKNTKFANSSGLPGKEQYTTVYDLTKIMSHALSYPLIREAIQTRVYIIHSEDGKEHFIQNTNQLLWTEDNMIGGKTGYTRQAGHCFVSAARIDNRVVYTALLGVPNRDKLWTDTQLLLARAEKVLSGKSEAVIQITNEKTISDAPYKRSAISVKKKDIIKTKKKIKANKDIKVKKLSNKKLKQKRKGYAKVNSQSI